jgi:hypothetical protein
MTTYRAEPTGSSPRLATFVGPEVVAAIIVVLVAIIGLVVVNAPAGTPAATPTPTAAAVGDGSPSPSASPSPTPAATPTPTPTPTPEPATPAPSPSPSGSVGGVVATPKPSPTPSPLPTLAPWAGPASALIAADAQVIEWRDVLRAAVDADAGRSDEMARGLRSLNPTLTVALGTIRTLERAGAPTDLLARLRFVHEDALATSIATLRNAIGDVAAYRAGTLAVLDALAPLESMLQELAMVGGLPDPYPGLPTPSDASGTP